MAVDDWRTEAIYWRFLAGDGVAAIAQAFEIGLEQVEHELRERWRHGPVVNRAGALTVVTTRPKAPPQTPKARRSRQPPADRLDWQARALQGLQGAPHPMPVGELVTRLRVKDAERKATTTRLWSALQSLVKQGRVVRTGTRYQLKTTEVA